MRGDTITAPAPVRNPNDQAAFRERIIQYQQEYFHRTHLFCLATLDGLIRPDSTARAPQIEAHHIIPWAWAVNRPNPIPLELVDARENGVMVRRSTHTTIHDIAKAQLYRLAAQRGIKIQKEDFRPIGVNCVTGATAEIFADSFLSLLNSLKRNEPLRSTLAKPVQGGQRFNPSKGETGEWEPWNHQAFIYILEQYYIDLGLRSGHHYNQYGYKADPNDRTVPEFKTKEDDRVYFHGTNYSLKHKAVQEVTGQPAQAVVYPGSSVATYVVQGSPIAQMFALSGEQPSLVTL